MSEPIQIRIAAPPSVTMPDPRLEVLPVRLSALWANRGAVWCGDFTVPHYGFGHIKLLTEPAPPGSFGIQQRSHHLLVNCDGFNRSILANPDLSVYAVIGPNSGVPDHASWSNAPMTVITRPAFSWQHLAGSGRTAALQIALMHVGDSEMVRLAAGATEILVYFMMVVEGNVVYINLDGVPGQNFTIPLEAVAETEMQTTG